MGWMKSRAWDQHEARSEDRLPMRTRASRKAERKEEGRLESQKRCKMHQPANPGVANAEKRENQFVLACVRGA